MVNSTEPKRKGRPPKKVQHPLFARLSEFTLDDYWKEILRSCSLGKFPRYVSYKTDQLIHRRGRAATSITLTQEMDQAEHFKLVINFFRGIGLCSLLDNEDNKRRVDEKQKVIQAQRYETWKEIKRQQVKDILITNHIDDLCEQYNLTPKEYRLLQATVSIASLFKYISPTTVLMKEGKITEIIGFAVEGEDRGKRRFSFPYNVSDSGSVSPSPMIRDDVEVSDQSKTLATAWTKYLDDMKRKQTFYQSLPQF